MKAHDMVNQFMKIMGQDMPDKPSIPSDAICDLRSSLIAEENKELREAANDGDIIQVADALCDSLYVVLGAFTAYGFSPALVEELFDEVQRSNMSKVCKTEEEATTTSLKYHTQDPPIPVYREKHGDYWVIARLSDRKVLKSINYSEPDLKSILERHGVKC